MKKNILMKKMISAMSVAALFANFAVIPTFAETGAVAKGTAYDIVIDSVDDLALAVAAAAGDGSAIEDYSLIKYPKYIYNALGEWTDDAGFVTAVETAVDSLLNKQYYGVDRIVTENLTSLQPNPNGQYTDNTMYEVNLGFYQKNHYLEIDKVPSTTDLVKVDMKITGMDINSEGKTAEKYNTQAMPEITGNTDTDKAAWIAYEKGFSELTGISVKNSTSEYDTVETNILTTNEITYLKEASPLVIKFCYSANHMMKTNKPADTAPKFIFVYDNSVTMNALDTGLTSASTTDDIMTEITKLNEIQLSGIGIDVDEYKKLSHPEYLADVIDFSTDIDVIAAQINESINEFLYTAKVGVGRITRAKLSGTGDIAAVNKTITEVAAEYSTNDLNINISGGNSYFITTETLDNYSAIRGMEFYITATAVAEAKSLGVDYFIGKTPSITDTIDTWNTFLKTGIRISDTLNVPLLTDKVPETCSVKLFEKDNSNGFDKNTEVTFLLPHSAYLVFAANGTAIENAEPYFLVTYDMTQELAIIDEYGLDSGEGIIALMEALPETAKTRLGFDAADFNNIAYREYISKEIDTAAISTIDDAISQVEEISASLIETVEVPYSRATAVNYDTNTTDYKDVTSAYDQSLYKNHLYLTLENYENAEAVRKIGVKITLGCDAAQSAKLVGYSTNTAPVIPVKEEYPEDATEEQKAAIDEAYNTAKAAANTAWDAFAGGVTMLPKEIVMKYNEINDKYPDNPGYEIATVAENAALTSSSQFTVKFREVGDIRVRLNGSTNPAKFVLTVDKTVGLKNTDNKKITFMDNLALILENDLGEEAVGSLIEDNKDILLLENNEKYEACDKNAVYAAVAGKNSYNSIDEVIAVINAEMEKQASEKTEYEVKTVNKSTDDNGNITVSTVVLTENKDISAVAIVAAYKAGTLVDVVSSTVGDAVDGEVTVTVNKTFAADAIKVFVWNSLAEMKPLAK